jgi:hypothetical protein
VPVYSVVFWVKLYVWIFSAEVCVYSAAFPSAEVRVYSAEVWVYSAAFWVEKEVWISCAEEWFSCAEKWVSCAEVWVYGCKGVGLQCSFLMARGVGWKKDWPIEIVYALRPEQFQ